MRDATTTSSQKSFHADCFAKNSDEAKEKAANAYPGCKIADVAITGSTL